MRYLLTFFLMLGSLLWAQPAGSGNTIDFDGNNDHITTGSIGTVSLPVSVSCWIRPTLSNSSHRIFFSHSSVSAYTGFWMHVLGGELRVVFGDGSARAHYARRAGAAPVNLQAGKWYHLAGVIHSATNMDLYLNGNSLSVSYGGSGSTTMFTDNSGGLIGVNSGGSSDYLNAQLDELTVWDKALTQQEIRTMMCEKLTGNETGLLAYYRFDDGVGTTLTNLVAGGPNGTLTNGPTWVASSAPVGDRSFYNYFGNNPAIGFSQSGDSVVVDPGPSTVEGTHLYFVDTLPNSTNGITVPPGVDYYFGAFNANNSRSYDVELYPGPSIAGAATGSLKLAKRPHNASPNWNLTTATNNPSFNLAGQSSISQYIIADDPCLNFDVSLGPDTSLCASANWYLARQRGSNENYQWSNGSTSDSILITTSGTYWLEVTRPGCVEYDTIAVTVYNNIKNYIPSDSVSCDSMQLSVNGPLDNFMWSNGVTTNTNYIQNSGTVWFQATDTLTGCLVDDTTNVTIINRSFFNSLSLDTTVCQADSFYYDISTNGAIGYQWSDGDTNSSRSFTSSDSLWFRRYLTPTCYLTDTLSVQLVPAESYFAADSTSCDSMQLDVTGPFDNFTWSNGATGNATFIQNSGPVWFQATDTLTGCLVDDTINATIVKRASYSGLSLDTTVCQADSFYYDITTNNAISYEWADGDTNAIRSFTSSDTLWFRRYLTPNCYLTDTLGVRLVPDINILPTDTFVCDSFNLGLVGPYNNINWSTGAVSSQIMIKTSGVFWFEAIDTVNGCLVTDSIQVTVFDESNFQSLSLDTLLCGVSNYNFDGTTTGATGYLWSDGSTQPMRAFTQDGSYFLERSFPGGCVIKDTVTLTFSELSEPLAEEEFFICENDSVVVELPANTYQAIIWSNGSNNRKAEYSQPGKYGVEVQNMDGCWQTDSFEVKLKPPLPTIEVFSDTSFCLDEGLWLEAPDDYLVRWPNGSRDNQYFVGRSQDVRVEISDGCTESVEVFEVTEYDCNCDVVFPNAFTPNDDGKNELFGPAAKCDYTDFDLTIINRWGATVFHSQSPDNWWDGKMNGEDLPEGVYLYKFTYSTTTGSGSRRGFLTLLR